MNPGDTFYRSTPRQVHGYALHNNAVSLYHQDVLPSRCSLSYDMSPSLGPSRRRQHPIRGQLGKYPATYRDLFCSR